MPTEIEAMAISRMVAMVALTDLQPATVPLTKQLLGLAVDPATLARARQRTIAILQFFEATIAERPYFTGTTFTVADIVAGTLVPSVAMFGIALAGYPRLSAWIDRLSQRESFRQTEPTPAQIQAALPTIEKILATR
jgi:glutathione S-transferase